MILELDGIVAGYGSKTVISGINLGVAEGEIVALLGHNGAGKTTTLKTAMGLIAPRAGHVRFVGKSFASAQVAERVASGLRLLPEGRGIFPDLSVAENIEVVAAQLVGRGAMFTQADVLRLLPVLQERRETRAGSMSGGQQQMLAFALALLGTPRCLLLDEPSIGLQPNLVERLFHQVRDVCRAHSVAAVLVEQNVAAALAIADRVVVMNSGRLVFEGTAQEARESNMWEHF